MSLQESPIESPAVAEAAAPIGDQFANIELAAIVEHPRNVRTVFDVVKLQEMADTIAHGAVNQAILVRPLPASRLQETFEGRRRGDPLPAYELVDGARRYRASKIAGKTTIPALIRPMDDHQVLEAQIVTALQRDGLTEMDEAEGYRRLVEETQVPKEDIGKKVGRSRSYVYQRLKLLELMPESREAFADGAIDSSRALRLARVPAGKLQKKALAEASRKNFDGSWALSVRQLELWLQQNVMLRLEQALFSIKDETLHATAGACTACPKRTGADPDLYPDVQGADICTDPSCFNAKAVVHRDRVVAKAEAKGMTVIEGKAAKEICIPYSNQLAGFSRLDQKRLDVDESGPTLRKLLGKDGPKRVLIEHPQTRELIEAVPTAEAEAALLAMGVIKTATSPVDTLEKKIEALESKADDEMGELSRAAMVAAIKEAVRTTPDDKVMELVSAELVRIWLLHQIDMYDAGEALVEILNLPLEEKSYEAINQAATNAIQAASDANVFRAHVLYLAADEAHYYRHSSRPQTAPALSAIAAMASVDLEATVAAARADRELQLRNDIAELREKHEPKPAADDLKATPEKKSKAPPAAQVKRAKKPSAQEVQAQVAEAFQALDSEKNDQAPDGAKPEEVAANAAGDQVQAPDGAVEEEGAAPAAQTGHAVSDRVRVTDAASESLGKEGSVTHVYASGQLRLALDDGTVARVDGRDVESLAKALWPFPSINGKPVDEAVQTTPEIKVGQIVRVREGARTPSGKARKSVGKVGRIVGTDGVHVNLRRGPASHQVELLPASDVEPYLAQPTIGSRVRVVAGNFLAADMNELEWCEGEVIRCETEDWIVRMDPPPFSKRGPSSPPDREVAFEPAHLEVLA